MMDKKIQEKVRVKQSELESVSDEGVLELFGKDVFVETMIRRYLGWAGKYAARLPMAYVNFEGGMSDGDLKSIAVEALWNLSESYASESQQAVDFSMYLKRRIYRRIVTIVRETFGRTGRAGTSRRIMATPLAVGVELDDGKAYENNLATYVDRAFWNAWERERVRAMFSRLNWEERRIIAAVLRGLTHAEIKARVLRKSKWRKALLGTIRKKVAVSGLTRADIPFDDPFRG
jgi:hypothetical protein